MGSTAPPGRPFESYEYRKTQGHLQCSLKTPSCVGGRHTKEAVQVAPRREMRRLTTLRIQQLEAWGSSGSREPRVGLLDALL
jgi:hypothetical protein